MSHETEKESIDLGNAVSLNPRCNLAVSEAKAILSIAKGENLIDIESETGINIKQLQKWSRSSRFYELLHYARNILYLAMTNTIVTASFEAVDMLKDISLGRNGESKSTQIKALKILIDTSMKIKEIDIDAEHYLIQEKIDNLMSEINNLRNNVHNEDVSEDYYLYD